MRYVILIALLTTACASPQYEMQKQPARYQAFKIERSKKDYRSSSYVQANQGISNSHPVTGVARQYTSRPKYD